MATFTATNESEAVVAAPRAAIWATITDPVLLTELTPLLRRIDVDGDRWRWHMTGLKVLGVGVAPVFTERMTFVEGTSITYTHDPGDGVRESAGAEGVYALSDVEGGTFLTIRLQLTVELPLPSLAGPAVRAVMEATMRATGERFSANLHRHLGISASPAGARSRSGSR